MTLVLDPVYIVNLILCLMILFLGVFGYIKKHNSASLYVGIAFGLFSVAHLATILGLKADIEFFLIAVRTIAYFLVGFALYKIITGPKKFKS